MRKIFICVLIAVCFVSTSFAQKKTATTSKKAQSKTITTPVSKTSQIGQAYENPVPATTKSTAASEKVKAVSAEDKYQMMIDENISKIRDVDSKLSEKKKAYMNDSKVKNNANISSELNKARFDMISEIVGQDAANYYIKSHSLN